MDPVFVFLFTRIASTQGFLVATTLIIIALILRRRMQEVFLFALAALGLLLSTNFIKEWLRVPRPDNALVETVGYAFPSGHAAGSAFLALSVCYFARHFKKPLRYGVYAVSILAALAIGVSRVMLNVHTPLQVVGGFALGALWAGLFIYCDRRRD